MREQAAIGVYRGSWGRCSHRRGISLSLPTPWSQRRCHCGSLFVSTLLIRRALSHGRTLGLPLFGHLDLDVMDSRTGDDVFNVLANISDYIVSSDAFLLPGQTIGYRDGEELAITQEVSPADQNPVLRILY